MDRRKQEGGREDTKEKRELEVIMFKRKKNRRMERRFNLETFPPSLLIEQGSAELLWWRPLTRGR
jgi:hypothetical protein